MNLVILTKSSSLSKTSLTFVIMLLVTILFDANGLMDNVSGMEFSPVRTVLMALARPVNKLSNALGFSTVGNEMRYRFQEASGVYTYTGFSNQQTQVSSEPITVSISFQDSVKQATVNTMQASDTVTVYSEDNPVNILLIGDSMMGYGFGSSMMQIFNERIEFLPERHYICSSGLSRPDFFNWPSQLQTIFNEDDYDAVIVMMGTNDSQDFRIDGVYYEYGTDVWFNIYKERTLSMLVQLQSNSERVYWIGMPPMRSNRFHGRMQNFNNIYLQCCDSLDDANVNFISTEIILGDESGSFTTYLTVNESTIRVRDNDGIHLSSRGGDLIAQVVLRKIVTDFNL